SVIGAVVYGVGTLISLGQRVSGFQRAERALSKQEREMLRRIYLNAVSLYEIRLIEGGSGVFEGTHRPFTLGNTIYMTDTDSAARPDIRVHESVHVWQYQNKGARYTMDALGAQQFIPNAYDWETDLQSAGRKGWDDLNAEAQAAFIQDLWRLGTM